MLWSREYKTLLLPTSLQLHLGLVPAVLKPVPESSRPFQVPASESLLLKTGGFAAASFWTEGLGGVL